MIKVSNHLGTIGISERYLKSLICSTVQSCFGVSAMNCFGAEEKFRSVLGISSPDSSGVIIRQENSSVSVELHISIAYGINVSAITESIAHKVDYVLNEQAGIAPDSINVYIDEIVN